MATVLPPDPSDAIIIRCRECFASLSYDISEVQTSRDSDGDANYWITCPRCEKDIPVSEPKC